MGNPNKNHHNHHNHHKGQQEPNQPSATSTPECMGCAAGHLEPFTAAMGLPIVSEQEVFMGMLTRTKMPFLFTPAEDDSGHTAISIPLGDGTDENGEPDTFDLMFRFDEYGRCVDTALV